MTRAFHRTDPISAFAAETNKTAMEGSRSMVRNLLKTAVLGAAIAGFAAAGAFAQADQPTGPQQDADADKTEQGMKCKMMGGGMMKGPEHKAAMLEGRIAYLKTALGITEAQMGTWNKYVAALKANQAKKQGMMGAKKKGTAIQKMDARIERTKARLQNLKAMNPATEALYSALNDEQKKKADALLGMGQGIM